MTFAREIKFKNRVLVAHVDTCMSLIYDSVYAWCFIFFTHQSWQLMTNYNTYNFQKNSYVYTRSSDTGVRIILGATCIKPKA